MKGERSRVSAGQKIVRTLTQEEREARSARRSKSARSSGTRWAGNGRRAADAFPLQTQHYSSAIALMIG